MGTLCCVDFESATSYLGRGRKRGKWRHFGNFDGATVSLGRDENAMNGDALVTSRAQQPTWAKRIHDKWRCIVNFESAASYLGSGGNTINGDTLVTSRPQQPTWAERRTR